MRDHIAFFDYVQKKGMYVIWPLYVPDRGTILRRGDVARVDETTGDPEANFRVVLQQIKVFYAPPAHALKF